MRILLTVAVLLTGSLLNAAVVRPAPNFTWQGRPGANSLKSVKGQPVVLVIAKSPKAGDFKKQAKLLKELYDEYAARGVIFAAAFTQEEGQIKSDIPFVIVNSGAKIAEQLGISDFGVAIVGKDGNLDLISSKVQPAYRVRDVIINSYEVQAAERRKPNQATSQ